jgi:hypothetical protein
MERMKIELCFRKISILFDNFIIMQQLTIILYIN